MNVYTLARLTIETMLFATVFAPIFKGRLVQLGAKTEGMMSR
jgi:hypothetical protein